jgi:hypothetical protein
MKTLFFFFPLLLICSLSTAQVNTFHIDSSKFNKLLMVTLDSLYRQDQVPRNKYGNAVYNKLSPNVIDSLAKIMRDADARNLIVVNKIIAQYGWLGPQKVGVNASQALFLVIQHADLKTQQAYLPMIRTAEKNGETLSTNLAILEDRINMREGKAQLYGSQGFTDKQTGKKYIYPVKDVDHLEERRKAMGMTAMKDYFKGWDVDDYKKTLPQILKAAGQQGILVK